MAKLKNEFKDISEKIFSVPEQTLPSGLLGALVYERGPRLFGNRMLAAGYRSGNDLNGVKVEDLLKDVPTTRKNFDKVVHWFGFSGIRLN